MMRSVSSALQYVHQHLARDSEESNRSWQQRMTGHKLFACVLLAASVGLLIAAGMEYSKDNDLFAQRIVELVDPEVPPDFQRFITYPLSKSPGASTKYVTVDGSLLYRRDYRALWAECLWHFVEETRMTDDNTATWLDEGYPHHSQFPSNLISRPSSDGWNACRLQLRAALTQTREDSLRSMLQSDMTQLRIENATRYGALGMATLFTGLWFFRRPPSGFDSVNSST